MGRLTRTILTMIIAVFMVVTNMLTPNTRAVTTVNAEAGKEPAHAKFRGNNGDGTYKLALNVTGDAVRKPQKVNVIVIVDRSGSMGESSGNTEVTYTPTSGTGNGLYGLVNGEYIALTRYRGAFYYQSNGQWVQYTGQRYTRQAANQSRLEATQEAVNNLAETLLGYNTQEGNDNDTVEMALVSFATNARTDIAETTSYDTFSAEVNDLTASGGTNWEAALQTAQNINFGDNDQTFVIFFSDGAPTFHSSDGGYNNWNRDYGVYGSGYEEEPNMERSYTQATDDARTLANKVGVSNFFTIFAYGPDYGDTYMQDLTSAAGAPAGNNYSAENTAALQAAFGEILTKIEMSGIGAVSIEDQTTANVENAQATSGISHLLTVDASSFKYYRAGGTNADGTVKYNPEANTMQGIASGEASESPKNLGVEWTAADDPAPPAATVNADGKVEWNLSSLGVLENGVTYTVTFDVYPSQETYDLIADLKNGTKTYSELDSNIRDYLHYDEKTQSFSLDTNKTATLNYDDTRVPNQEPKTATYVNPPAVPTVAEQLNVVKEWHGTYDDEEKAASIDMDVLRNGTKYKTVTLTYDGTSMHKGSAFISTGLMRVNKTAGTVQVLDSGYDYKLVEPTNLSYHWELQADTLHPMLINGVLTVLKEDTAPTGMETRDYYSDGTYEYYKINGKVYSNHTDATALKAVNTRRANLNLKKVVTGNDAPADTYFTFKMKVNNPGNSKEKFYFSVWNDGYVVDREIPEAQWADKAKLIAEEGFTVSGAALEQKDGKYTGFYEVEPGAEVTVKLKKDWNLRFTNVLTGTSYRFEEVTPLATGYTFVSAAASAVESGSDPAKPVTVDPIASALVVNGSVNVGNVDYTVTYTNQYNPVKKAPSVTKKVEGWDAVEDDDFTFEISAADDATRTAISEKHVVMPNPATVSTGTGMVKDQQKTVKFGEIEFTRPGTYVFEIKETTKATKPGWTYDDATHNVTITVTENADTGLLEATIDGDNPVFTNTYHAAPTTAVIPVRKDVTPGEGLAIPDIAGKFTFTLRPRNGAPMPNDAETATVTSTTAGATLNFPAITYSAPGEYQYELTETYTNGKDAGGVTIPSTAPSIVTVKVEDDGSGVLKAEVNGSFEPTFNNPYNVEKAFITIPVEKILSVPAGLSAPDITNKFTFKLDAGEMTLADGTTGTSPLPKTTEKTNPAANGGSITFGGEGDPIEITKPGEYTYTVTESGTVPGITNADPASKTITFTVTDVGGKLKIEADPTGSLQFTNTYNVKPNTGTISAAKVLSVGNDAVNVPDVSGQYDLVLTAGTATYTDGTTGTSPMPKEKTSFKNPDGKGTADSFGEIKFEKPGTYTYTVSENGSVTGVVNDSAASSKIVTITVTDNKNGTLTVSTPETVVFTNSYYETTVTIPVKKTMSVPAGFTGPAEWSYTITVTPNGDAPAAKTMTGTVTKDNPTITFGGADDKIIFNHEGTYTYTVTENGTVDGVTNDEAAATGKTVKVTVVRNEDGTLVAKNENADLEFVNTYDAKAVDASFPVEKILYVPAGLEGPADWSYDIAVKAAEGSPTTETMTGTVTKAEPTVTFGPFNYTKPGTYTYTVSEKGTIKGVDNDTAAAGKTVTVTVADDGKGALTATVSSTVDKPLQFTNSYRVNSTSIVPKVNKFLEKEDGLNAPDITGKYTFTLAAGAMTLADGTTGTSPMPADGKVEVKNPAKTGGEADFGEISFSAPGTYKYTVTESGNVDGVTNDSVLTKEFTVTVTDDGTGKLTPTIDYGNGLNHVLFTNTYTVKPTTAKIPVEKILEVPEGLTAGDITGKFTFTLTAADGTPMPVVTSYTNPKADGGTVEFGDITYNKPGMYTYTVTETGSAAGVTNDETASKPVQVYVKDNGNGTMTATVINGGTSFTNKYDVKPTTVSFPVKKELTVPEGLAGPTDWSYTINVSANDGAPGAATMSGTVTKAEPTITFGEFTYTKPGTYKYTVTETGTVAGVANDDAATTGKTVTVTVVDNGNGTLTATADSTTDRQRYTDSYCGFHNRQAADIHKHIQHW